MPPRLFLLCGALVTAMLFHETASAQQYLEFLGRPKTGEIKYSPKYNIPYRDNGFNAPKKRKWKKAANRNAPEWVIEEIKAFPGAPDAIGVWVDEAFDAARASFTKCGGHLAAFAAGVTPGSVTGVTIESTIWYEPALQKILAGGYYPDTRSIRVVNVYYGSTGQYRHARLLLIWEMKNHFAFLAGLQSEPTFPAWPCGAR
ncbi:MAG TPA: hypothetical protein VE262_12840 [Blastocatellia bacterium]|nr:hypothetical protein [Blastocatellia bacterium]